ncbi:MAG: hypothetical protein ABIR79_17245 [Candidatus Binatia bacterium]
MSPLTVGIIPPIVHARGAHQDCSGAERDLPGASFAVADDQGMALVVAFVFMREGGFS